ncbi:MAG: hypothetical protein AAGA92_09815 [Planctomycetota bacterium]
MSDSPANAVDPSAGPAGLSPLPVEEYIEQAHFFTILSERVRQSVPAQEVLASVRDEVLATANLPMAIDFLLAELRHQGELAPGMWRLSHYFTPFQCFVMSEAENDRRRFDIRIALEILRREAKYRSEGISLQGLFLFQLETLCRNRLGYDEGLDAVAGDPSYPATWRDWVLTLRRQIGIIELTDLIYVRSEFYRERSRHDGRDEPNDAPALFGIREGRIAWANRRKDPLLLFSALHRQLGYPAVPKPSHEIAEERLLAVLARRVEQLESRLKLVEEEQRGGIDLNRFYEANRPADRPSDDLV